MLMMSIKKNLNPQGDVILRNEAVQRVTKAKFLGVIVDQHLNCKRPHINGITQNFKIMWHNIRIRNILDIKSKVSYTPILLTVSMSGHLPIELI